MNEQTKQAIQDAIDFLDGSYEAHKIRKALQEALAQPAQEPDRTGMIYYKNDACKAKDANSPDCICWTHKQPTQEPVLLNVKTHNDKTYKIEVSAPSWQGLSDDEVDDFMFQSCDAENGYSITDLIRLVEQSLKDKNS